MANEPMPSAEAAGHQRLRFFTFALLGVVLGGIGFFVIRARLLADPTPPLEPADFHAAQARWLENAPPNYNLDVRVSGTQPAVYHVEVRNGEATVATRNGTPLSQRRVFSTWSVDGMFSTMARDVEVVERAAAPAPGDQPIRRLTLRARFDDQWDFPAVYRRIEWGSPVEVAWEVVRFEVVDPQAANDSRAINPPPR